MPLNKALVLWVLAMLVPVVAGCAHSEGGNAWDLRESERAVIAKAPDVAVALSKARAKLEPTAVLAAARASLADCDTRILFVSFGVFAGYESTTHQFDQEDITLSGKTGGAAEPVVVCVGVKGDRLKILGNTRPFRLIPGGEDLQLTDALQETDFWFFDLSISEMKDYGKWDVAALISCALSGPRGLSSSGDSNDGAEVYCLQTEHSGQISTAVAVNPTVRSLRPGEKGNNWDQQFRALSDLVWISWQAVAWKLMPDKSDNK